MAGISPQFPSSFLLLPVHVFLAGPARPPAPPVRFPLVAYGRVVGIGWKHVAAMPRAILGGLLGSMLGTMTFKVINAGLFPLDLNYNVIPTEQATRNLVYLCVALFIALGAVMVGPHGSRTHAGLHSAN
jgi:hypothetical protein